MLHLHAAGGEVSVAQIIEEGLSRHLAPQLSRLASEELVQLNALLDRVSLREGDDQRHCPLNRNVMVLQTVAAYNKIQCHANLVKKHILDNPSCELCGQVEDCNHIIFRCSFASQVWESLGAQTVDASVQLLWTVHRPTTVPVRHFTSFLLLIS